MHVGLPSTDVIPRAQMPGGSLHHTLDAGLINTQAEPLFNCCAVEYGANAHDT